MKIGSYLPLHHSIPIPQKQLLSTLLDVSLDNSLQYLSNKYRYLLIVPFQNTTYGLPATDTKALTHTPPSPLTANTLHTFLPSMQTPNSFISKFVRLVLNNAIIITMQILCGTKPYHIVQTHSLSWDKFDYHGVDIYFVFICFHCWC